MYKLLNPVLGPNNAVVIPQMVLKTDTNSYIPMSPDNTDYQAYLKWLAEGNTPEAADAATLPAENA
jgi:hypothetical protein